MSGVKVQDLGVSLRDGTKIVRDICFSIEPGHVMGLVGESGSGKSTIARALLGYASRGSLIDSGSIVIDGENLLALNQKEIRAKRGQLVSYVPQDAGISLNPALRIGVQLTERLRVGKLGLPAEEALQRVRKVLAAVHLPTDDAFLRRYPSELSGGQLQRIGFAVAVVGNPKLLVLDEPTTALDTSTRKEVLGLVSRLNRELGICSIYVSHDLGVISAVADHVMVLYAGRTMEYASGADLFRNPAHPYTRALLSAVPSTEERRSLVGIPGMAPNVRSTFHGCSFSSRCPMVTDACRTQEPEVRSADGRGVRCFYPFADVDSGVRKSIGPRSASPHNPILTVTGLTASYHSKVVLRDISLEVSSGECVALVGESGSGKSTLSRCIVGLHSEYEGKVSVNGLALATSARGRSRAGHRVVQYIFQDPYGSLHPRRTVGDSIAIAFRHFFPNRRSETEAEVVANMLRAGLAESLRTRYPDELSGGERQRVAIARALICRPDLLVCDEATSALDVSVQATVVELLRQLMSEGMAVLFVTHDLAVVRSLADRVVVLNRGVVAESADVETVFNSPTAVYTTELLRHTMDVR